MGQPPEPTTAGEGLAALHSQLVDMADIVESAIAESILAFVDADSAAAKEARLDDYRAHNARLRLDGLCGDLLSGTLTAADLRFVCASVKIGMDLKFMADEAMRINQHMAILAGGSDAKVESAQTVFRIAEMTQSMFGDGVEALVSHHPGEARGLHGIHRELGELQAQYLEQVTGEIEGGSLSPSGGVAGVLVTRSFQRIGDYVLDLANHVARLYDGEEPGDAERAEGQ